MLTLMMPLWLACTPEVAPGGDSGGCSWFSDSDGDGYGYGAAVSDACDTGAPGLVSRSGDCNDLDPSVNPGATELCNGEDDDCDKAIDEGDPDNAPWYIDVDADGYGTSQTDPVLSCEQPEGHSKFDGDCDDLDPLVNPGADEICNGQDDDCDSLIDDDDELAVGGLFYRDGDSDGYGRSDVVAQACQPPSAYVATSGDCNDANSTIHPGAREICDGLDQDCDEAIDEDASDAVTWGLDSDNDGHGRDTSATEACEPPGGDWVADTSDCDDDRADVNPLASETCDGADQDCDGTVDEDPVDGQSWYADSDTDGFGDPTTAVVACAEPAGHVANDDDCYDGNKRVNPDQVTFFNGDRGDGSWDYDCDGTEEPERSELADCDGAFDEGEREACSLDSEGWDDSAPDCGDKETWVTACLATSLTCEPTGSRETQACR